MPIERPRFAQLNVAQLQAKMDQLGKLVDGARATDGSVDVDALSQTVAQANDPALTSAFERVQHDYRRQVGTQLGGGDSPSLIPVLERPATLEAGEVKSVMSALIAAKSALTAADSDHDGQIDRGEALGLREAAGDDAAVGIASAAVTGSRAEFEAALEGFFGQSQGAAYDIHARQYLNAVVTASVERRVETPVGQEAAKWFLRKALVGTYRNRSTQLKSESGIERILQKASDSFWTRLFGAGGKHLDNNEIANLVGTRDLAAYVKDTEAGLETTLGAPFLEAFLDGTDIADPTTPGRKGYRFVPPQS